MPDSQETIIRLDHTGKYAEIWTRDRAIISLMRRVGAEALDRQIQGQWWRVGFRVLGRGIRLANPDNRPARPRTVAQLAALAKGRVKTYA